jgi:hypothetical protein
MPVLTLAAVFHAAKNIKTAAGVAKWIALIPKNPTKDLESAKRDMMEWWVSELAEQEANQARYLEEVGADVEEIKAILTAPEFQRVFNNYAFEAEREAIDERRRMLQFAFCGSVDPCLTLAEIARTERAIRELDPPDVLQLSNVSFRGDHGDAARDRWEMLRGSPCADALVGAGCIRISTVEGGAGEGARQEASLTKIGRNVLVVLRAYILAMRPESKKTATRSDS